MNNAMIFQGKMNLMANSIDLLLGFILENIKLKPPKMLGTKISEFKGNMAILSLRYSGDFSELVQDLRKFNEHWITTKHGMVVGGQEINDLTFHKDGKFHIFNKKTQNEIDSEFTQTMQNITEIHNSLINNPI